MAGFIEAMPRHHESPVWCVASLRQSEPKTTKMRSDETDGKIDSRNGLYASNYVKNEGGSTIHQRGVGHSVVKFTRKEEA